MSAAAIRFFFGPGELSRVGWMDGSPLSMLTHERRQELLLAQVVQPERRVSGVRDVRISHYRTHLCIRAPGEPILWFDRKEFSDF